MVPKGRPAIVLTGGTGGQVRRGMQLPIARGCLLVNRHPFILPPLVPPPAAPWPKAGVLLRETRECHLEGVLPSAERRRAETQGAGFTWSPKIGEIPSSTGGGGDDDSAVHVVSALGLTQPPFPVPLPPLPSSSPPSLGLWWDVWGYVWGAAAPTPSDCRPQI